MPKKKLDLSDYSVKSSETTQTKGKYSGLSSKLCMRFSMPLSGNGPRISH